MSKAKGQKRAGGGEVFRNGTKPAGDSIKIKCIYPPCSQPVIVSSPPTGVEAGSQQHLQKLGGVPMCPKHAGWLTFYMWCLVNVRMEAQRTASGLVLPGNEKFQATIKQQGSGVRDAGQEGTP